MVLQQRLYDIDELWDLYGLPESDTKRFELIDGALIEMSGPGGTHGRIAIKFGRFLDEYADNEQLGIVTSETGYHPADSRLTLLLPDVAFVSHNRAPDPFPEKFVPLMPDLVVEIRSPISAYQGLRDKAQIYLRYGARLVWIVMPATQAVEVHRADGTVDTVFLDDTLSGEDVLPGFELDLRAVFP